MMPRLDKMLHGDVNQNQRPSYTKPVAVLRPVRRNTRGHMVQQVHIREQKDVISYAVSAVEVDVKRAEHPNLDNRERAENIRRKRAQGCKAVFKIVHKRVVSADYVNKNQVVYQLEVLNLFLLFSEKRHSITQSTYRYNYNTKI